MCHIDIKVCNPEMKEAPAMFTGNRFDTHGKVEVKFSLCFK